MTYDAMPEQLRASVAVLRVDAAAHRVADLVRRRLLPATVSREDLIAVRKTLLKFAREAEKLGLAQLLMSVHWVTVPDLETNAEDSEDELIRLIAQYNWLDLRGERLEDRESSAYRKAVVALAERLAERGELARQVADAVTARPHPG